ncbi:hypothetical protein [Nostoc sp. UHCC 0870]|uniref:hypothetical protein n=1 Tax=Nostoc sp. UHCC 0870 TaxID=2914041 RepID=UPI001EDE3AAC|nr:hypothetical protein [Nostoc sp. UHCC 0870]UKO99363.1 hypothetical protein L6494_06520 [Nostoc sp. UHCC 0870]
MRLNPISPVNNADFLITIEGLSSVYWTQFSGVKASFKRSTFNDGLSNATRTTEGGNKEYQTVTISKPHDPETDGPVFDFIKQKEGGTNFDLTLRPVKRVSNAQGTDTFRGNKAWRLTGCKISSWMCADGIDTADGTKTVMLQIEFSVETAEFS